MPAPPLPWLTWNFRLARAQVGMTAGRAECAGVVGAAEAAVAVSAVAQPTARTTAARRTVLTENSMNVPLDDGGPIGRPTWEDAGRQGRVDRLRRLGWTAGARVRKGTARGSGGRGQAGRPTAGMPSGTAAGGAAGPGAASPSARACQASPPRVRRTARGRPSATR